MIYDLSHITKVYDGRTVLDISDLDKFFTKPEFSVDLLNCILFNFQSYGYKFEINQESNDSIFFSDTIINRYTSM